MDSLGALTDSRVPKGVCPHLHPARPVPERHAAPPEPASQPTKRPRCPYRRLYGRRGRAETRRRVGCHSPSGGVTRAVCGVLRGSDELNGIPQLGGSTPLPVHRRRRRSPRTPLALGELEVVLGETIASFERDLFRRGLTPRQQEERLERTAQAIENNEQHRELIPHFPYQPCWAGRNQQQNYLM